MSAPTPDEFLSAYPPDMRDIADGLRSIVRDTLPQAVEAVRPGWRLIGYDVPFGRRRTYIAFVAPEPEHVHLGFQNGVLMDDPGRLLQGGFLRRVQFLTFRRIAELEPDVLGQLLREAVRVSTLGRAQRLALLLDRDEPDMLRPA